MKEDDLQVHQDLSVILLSFSGLAGGNYIA